MAICIARQDFRLHLSEQIVGKLKNNFNNFIQFSDVTTGQSYDPKLLLAYYAGSIINGTTTATDYSIDH